MSSSSLQSESSHINPSQFSHKLIVVTIRIPSWQQAWFLRSLRWIQSGMTGWSRWATRNGRWIPRWIHTRIRAWDCESDWRVGLRWFFAWFTFHFGHEFVNDCSFKNCLYLFEYDTLHLSVFLQSWYHSHNLVIHMLLRNCIFTFFHEWKYEMWKNTFDFLEIESIWKID